jgi:cytochrome b561
LLSKNGIYATEIETMSTKLLKIVFSIMCLLMMFAPIVGAAAENDTFKTTDFIKISGAKQELENSAFKDPVEKGSNWGTLALVAVIIIYYAGCLYKYFTGDDDERAKAFKGFFVGVIAIVLFMACTSTGLDALTWNY